MSLRRRWTGGPRRGSRQRVVQVLYAWRLGGERSPEMLELVRRHFPDMDTGEEGPVSPEDVSYTNWLVEGLLHGLDGVDERLAKVSVNWKLSRMGAVELSVLRLGVYELVHARDVPGPVVVSEAVALADLYGHERSPAFVNGLLEVVRRQVRAGELENRS